MVFPDSIQGFSIILENNQIEWSYATCCIFQRQAKNNFFKIPEFVVKKHDPHLKFVAAGVIEKSGDDYVFKQDIFKRAKTMLGNRNAHGTKTVTDSVTVTDTVTVKVQSLDSDCDSEGTVTDSVLLNKYNIKENTVTSEPKAHERVVEIWNTGAKKLGFPCITTHGKVFQDRKKKLIAAMKDIPDPEDWRKIFNVAAGKGFTKPDGSSWTPNWDYVFRNNNFQKFLEEASTEKKNTVDATEWIRSQVGMS